VVACAALLLGTRAVTRSSAEKRESPFQCIFQNYFSFFFFFFIISVINFKNLSTTELSPFQLRNTYQSLAISRKRNRSFCFSTYALQSTFVPPHAFIRNGHTSNQQTPSLTGQYQKRIKVLSFANPVILLCQRLKLKSLKSKYISTSEQIPGDPHIFNTSQVTEWLRHHKSPD